MMFKVKATIISVDALPDRQFLVTLHGVDRAELLDAVGESIKQDLVPKTKMSVSQWIAEDFKTN